MVYGFLILNMVSAVIKIMRSTLVNQGSQSSQIFSLALNAKTMTLNAKQFHDSALY
jgi:hypothetical protein